MLTSGLITCSKTYSLLTSQLFWINLVVVQLIGVESLIEVFIRLFCIIVKNLKHYFFSSIQYKIFLNFFNLTKNFFKNCINSWKYLLQFNVLNQGLANCGPNAALKVKICVPSSFLARNIHFNTIKIKDFLIKTYT